VKYRVWSNATSKEQYLEKIQNTLFCIFYEHSGTWIARSEPLSKWIPHDTLEHSSDWTILIASDDLGIILDHEHIADDIKTGICRWLM